MRPDNKYDRSRRLGTSRARTHLKADLGWLRGFPLRQNCEAIVWWQWKSGKSLLWSEIRLDRESIRRAEFSLNKFEHQYRKFLPDLVPESDQWPERVRLLLGRLKIAIHAGDSLPACLPEAIDTLPASVRGLRAEILRRNPTLEPLVDASSWTLFLDPAASRSALNWMAGHAREVTVLLANYDALRTEERLARVMSLWQMAHRHGEVRTEKVLRYLGDPRSHKTPFADEAYVHYLRHWTRKLSGFQPSHHRDPVPDPPATTVADRIHGVALWIAQQPDAVQVYALDLFNLLVDDSLLYAWQAFADRVESAVAVACRLTVIASAAQLDRQLLNAQADVFKKLSRDELPDIRLQELPQELASLLRPGLRSLREELLRTLPLLPISGSSQRVRNEFFHAAVSRSTYTSGEHVAAAVRHFRAYLSGDDPERLLAPWLGNSRPFSAVFTSGGHQAEHATAFFAALRSLVDRGTWLGTADVETIDCLADELSDVDEVVACFEAMKAAGVGEVHVYHETLRCAYRLRQGGANFGECVLRLLQMDSDSSDPVMRAVEAMQASGQIGIAANFARHAEYGLLIMAGRRLEGLQGLADFVGTAPSSILEQPVPEWVRRYPAELNAALTRLATLATDAESVAKRVLLKEFPPTAAVECEISALQDLLKSRSDDSRLQNRLSNLRARLTGPATISPARLDNLRTRLELAASRSWIENWIRRVEEQVRAKVCTLLGFSNVPEWVWTESNLGLLAAIAKLEGRFRELGLLIFRRRCGPPPWDFQGEPVNQDFLALLRDRGVDPDPWVSPPAPVWVEDAKGRHFQLGFELDPLEVLRMGEPFDTCLSPAGFNFFSAIANAIDINKRVIYARDSGGKIIGRCLLALTDLGGMLTFRVYQNTNDLNLRTHVSRMVEGLAAQMGVHVAKQGTVAKLVAPNWYDDGPQDFGGGLAFLAPGSAFRASLATVPLTDFLHAIESACEPLPFNDLMLALLLESDEFDRRPELILPLIPAVESARHIPETTRWRVAGWAHKAGRSDFASQVLNRRALSQVVRAIKRHGICPCCSELALRALVELDPTTVVRALRKTREKGVRDDEAEYQGRRRELLAAAHERLGRDVLAARLREPR